MSFGKGSNTTTSTQQPNSQAMGAYSGLLSQAGLIGSTPYQQYGGELTAGINPEQYAGVGNINANAGFAQPYIQQAGQYAQEAAAPITAAQIQQYESPYTQQVVNATQAQFNNQNAQQQSQVQGKAAAQGALGGDRTAVAQALTAGQQQMAQAPVIAGLENQGYTNAQQTALAEQQNLGQAAYSMGNLGVAGQNAALTGANAQVGAGSLEQQTQQAQDTALMNAFYQQEFAPEAMLSWQAGIDTGVGSNMGGTSTTTGPPPNALAQLLGLGTAGLGAYGAWAKNQSSARGGRIAGFAPRHYAAGGGLGSISQYFTDPWIPQMQITHGSGAPKPPSLPSQQQNPALSPQNLGNAISGLGKAWTNSPAGDAAQDAAQDAGDDAAEAAAGGTDAAAAATDAAAGGGEVADLLPMLLLARRGGAIHRRSGVHGYGGRGLVSSRPIAGFDLGGGVHGYDDGGGVDDWGPTDPGAFAPDLPADLTGGTPDPMALGPTPLGDIDPASGFAFNPVRTDANRAYNEPVDVADIPLPPSRPGRGNLGDVADDVTGGVSPIASGVAIRPASHGAPDLPPRSKEAGFGGLFHMSDAASNALMAAGLGMMASRSPFLANAVGEGGLAGLSAYSGTKRQEVSDKQVADKLAQHAEETRKKFDFETAREARMKEQEEARTAYQNKVLEQGRVPAGYRFNNGNLEAIPGGPADPEAVARLAGAKRPKGTEFDNDTIKVMADAIQSGNPNVLTNLGAGAQKAENVAKVWNEIAHRVVANGGTGADLNAARANFTAQMGAAKSQAIRAANVEANIEEARQTFPLALEASKAVPRTQFVPLNRAMQMVEAGTSSPELKKFVTANAGVVTAYSQAMARAGVATVDGRHAAESLLSTADSQEAYEAVLGQMEKEMHAAAIAPETVRQGILSRISGRPAPPPAGGGASPPQEGERRQFKQGWGVFHNGQWVPAQ